MKGLLIYIIGAVLGAVLGFLYYKFVGCASGACPITSNPNISTVYGAILGVLIAGIFKR
ncbi:MAG: YtxH domain-containing protein [Clostridiales bacterium]|nr:YtxH domain-containing protein [Clostridiales bacterium]